MIKQEKDYYIISSSIKESLKNISSVSLRKSQIEEFSNKLLPIEEVYIKFYPKTLVFEYQCFFLDLFHKSETEESDFLQLITDNFTFPKDKLYTFLNYEICLAFSLPPYRWMAHVLLTLQEQLDSTFEEFIELFCKNSEIKQLFEKESKKDQNQGI